MATTDLIRYCGDCRGEQVFERFHQDGCPDSPDGECQEAGCTACGSAIIIGLTGRGYIAGDSVSRAA